jgi:hypothetical protein
MGAYFIELNNVGVANLFEDFDFPRNALNVLLVFDAGLF